MSLSIGTFVPTLAEISAALHADAAVGDRRELLTPIYR